MRTAKFRKGARVLYVGPNKYRQGRLFTVYSCRWDNARKAFYYALVEESGNVTGQMIREESIVAFGGKIMSKFKIGDTVRYIGKNTPSLIGVDLTVTSVGWCTTNQGYMCGLEHPCGGYRGLVSERLLMAVQPAIEDSAISEAKKHPVRLNSIVEELLDHKLCKVIHVDYKREVCSLEEINVDQKYHCVPFGDVKVVGQMNEGE